MKPTNRWAAAAAAGFSALALSSVFVVVYAQQLSQKNSAPVVSSKHVGAVSSAGSSNSKVTLRLTFDNGAIFTVTQYEGEMIRVERDGSAFGIATHIDTGHSYQVTAKILKVLPVTAPVSIADEGTVEISSVELGRKALELPVGELGVTAEVISITYDLGTSRERKRTSRVHIYDDLIGGGDPQCCLTCSGVTVCGCRVSGDCGSCCVGTCC